MPTHVLANKSPGWTIVELKFVWLIVHLSSRKRRIQQHPPGWRTRSIGSRSIGHAHRGVTIHGEQVILVAGRGLLREFAGKLTLLMTRKSYASHAHS